jgi:hypothetical protein
VSSIPSEGVREDGKSDSNTISYIESTVQNIVLCTADSGSG